jgi:hypothetical protein
MIYLKITYRNYWCLIIEEHLSRPCLFFSHADTFFFTITLFFIHLVKHIVSNQVCQVSLYYSIILDVPSRTSVKGGGGIIDLVNGAFLTTSKKPQFCRLSEEPPLLRYSSGGLNTAHQVGCESRIALKD